jgi:hypothetical protein
MAMDAIGNGFRVDSEGALKSDIEELPRFGLHGKLGESVHSPTESETVEFFETQNQIPLIVFSGCS